MSDPAESAAPEWRIVQVTPAAPDDARSIALAAYLNDNTAPGRHVRARVWQRLEAFVNHVLRARGVRVPAAGSAPEAAPSAGGPPDRVPGPPGRP